MNTRSASRGRSLFLVIWILCAASVAILGQTAPAPEVLDSFEVEREGTDVPQDPHLLAAFLPNESLGFPLRSRTTDVRSGMPMAEAAYRSGNRAVRIRLYHLWSDPGAEFLVDLRRRTEEGLAATSSINAYDAYFFQEENQSRMVLIIADRYALESAVMAAGATSREARRALSDVDLDALRRLIPETEGLQRYRFQAAGFRASLDYPARWMLLDATDPTESMPSVVIMREPAPRAPFLDPGTPLTLGENAAVIVTVFARPLSGDPGELLESIQALLPLGLRDTEALSPPRYRPAYGEEAAGAGFRGRDRNNEPVWVRVLIYNPGAATAQVQLVSSPDAGREVEGAFETVAGSLNIAR